MCLSWTCAIPGTASGSLHAAGARLFNPEALAARHLEIPRDRDIVLFCSCPSEATAAKTAMALHKLGIERVRPLRGGYDEWKRLGFPLEAVPPPPLYVLSRRLQPGSEISGSRDKQGGDAGPDRRTNSAAWVGPGSGIEAVVAHRDVVESRLVFPERGGYKTSLVPNEANRPAKRGPSALVPPTTARRMDVNLVAGVGSASAATSGTMRLSRKKCQRAQVERQSGKPAPGRWSNSRRRSLARGLAGVIVPDCLLGGSFVGSSTRDTWGQEEDNPRWPCVPPSLESLSPAAAKTIMPASVAVCAADSICSAAVLPQLASSEPQEMVQTSQPSVPANSTAEAMSCDQ